MRMGALPLQGGLRNEIINAPLFWNGAFPYSKAEMVTVWQ